MKINYMLALFWVYVCTAIPPELFKPWTNQTVEYVGKDEKKTEHSHYFKNI